jgi:hypothetical protein
MSVPSLAHCPWDPSCANENFEYEDMIYCCVDLADNPDCAATTCLLESGQFGPEETDWERVGDCCLLDTRNLDGLCNAIAEDCTRVFEDDRGDEDMKEICETICDDRDFPYCPAKTLSPWAIIGIVIAIIALIVAIAIVIYLCQRPKKIRDGGDRDKSSSSSSSSSRRPPPPPPPPRPPPPPLLTPEQILWRTMMAQGWEGNYYQMGGPPPADTERDRPPSQKYVPPTEKPAPDEGKKSRPQWPSKQ